MLFFILSFIGGVLTVLAPCVLPLLPVIVGGSLADGKADKKRAFIISASLGVSVIAFTFILKVSTLFIVIPQSVWSWISATIIIVFGIVTLFPSIWEHVKFMARLNRSSNKMMGAGYKKQSVWGDIIIGASLGPVFSTCSPTYFLVLATVLPQSPVVGFVDLVAYAVGLCGALLVVAILGQKIMVKLDIAADPKGWFKRTLGILFVLVGIAIFTGADKRVEAWLLESGLFDITKVEQSLIQSSQKVETVDQPSEKLISTTTEQSAPPVSIKPSFLTSTEKALRYKRAPEIVNPSGFVNTGGVPITVSQFKGKKVVLLDIWTYSCINCQRTLPYVADWYEKYKDQGLEIISIHTPEFSFEKVQANVEAAAKRLGVKYPIVLDNDYSTWNALGNTFWPRKYLVDVDGYIVYDHIGEGGYDETETAIQKALLERADRLGLGDMSKKIPDTTGSASQPAHAIAVDPSRVRSPEVYFGSARSDNFHNGLDLKGPWNLVPEYAENSGPADIYFNYDAKNVYMVAAAPVSSVSSTSGIEIEIYRDDLLVKKLTIQANQLYQLIEGTDYGKHSLHIKVPKAGLQAFTFTFG